MGEVFHVGLLTDKSRFVGINSRASFQKRMGKGFAAVILQ